MENKFREFMTSAGAIVLGGRNAKNNEEIVAQVEPGETVLHTAKPGSPFVNIKGKASHQDILDAAIFCAKHSQDWRDNQEDVEVHIFKAKDIYKEKGMKTGTFGVKNFDVIKVKKHDIKKL
jgi:predicted ribosome quality control (RQC) complex YloA/Tae2 family protein